MKSGVKVYRLADPNCDLIYPATGWLRQLWATVGPTWWETTFGYLPIDLIDLMDGNICKKVQKK